MHIHVIRPFIFFALPLILILGVLQVGVAQGAILTLKGANDADGDTIVLPEGAELDLAVSDAGITLTLPGVDVRVLCLGDPTEEGYCLLEADSGGGGGGGGPQPIVDTDGDGVPDDNDNCAGTPSGSFVNSSGCSESQLGGGGGGGGGPVDSDGDGVPDTQDNCPNTANADQADNDNDGQGNVCDSTPNGPDDPPPTGGYCSNPQQSNVDCSANTNFDTWYESDGERTLTINVGRRLSIPFTARASTSDEAKFTYATDAATLPSGQTWYGYVSALPGGTSLSQDCVAAGPEARTTFTITQNQSSSNCKIPTSGGVFYLNYFVSGNQSTRYRFNVSRSAQRLAAGSGK